MRFAAIMGAAVVLTTYAAAPAFAQAPYYPTTSQSFTQTANATTFTVSSPVSDGRGGIAAPAVSDGTLSGTPINGTYHVQEIRTYSADGTTGTMQGQFTLQDGAGSSLIGTLNGNFTLDPTSSSVTGDYVITGGTGAYAGSGGTGTFSELLALPDGTPLLTFAGTWAGGPGVITTTTAPTIYSPPVYSPPSISVSTAPLVQPVVIVPAPVRIRANNDDHSWNHDHDEDSGQHGDHDRDHDHDHDKHDDHHDRGRGHDN